MKKYIYTLLLLFLMGVCASAQNKIDSRKFKDGSVYVGEMQGKFPHGKGRTVFKNGDKYEGEYVMGKRQGEGTYLFHDGEKYVGEWF